MWDLDLRILLSPSQTSGKVIANISSGALVWSANKYDINQCRLKKSFHVWSAGPLC